MLPDTESGGPVFARIDKIAHVAIPLLQPTSGPPPVSLAAFVTPGKEVPVIAPEMAYAEPVKPPSAAPGILTMNALVRPPAPGEAIVPTLADFTKSPDQPLTLRVKKQRKRKRATAPREWAPPMANGVRIQVAPKRSRKRKKGALESVKEEEEDDANVLARAQEHAEHAMPGPSRLHAAPPRESKQEEREADHDELPPKRETEEAAIPGPSRMDDAVPAAPATMPRTTLRRHVQGQAVEATVSDVAHPPPIARARARLRAVRRPARRVRPN